MFAWWSSIDIVGEINHYTYLATIISGGITFLLAYLAQLTGKRQSKLEADSISLMNQKFSVLSSEADDVKAQLVHTQNKLAEAREELRSSENIAKSVKADMKELKSRYKKAEQKIQELTQKFHDIKNGKKGTSAPPPPKAQTLTPEQREHLEAVLGSHIKGHVDIVAIMDDKDSQSVAKDIDKIFQAYGWDTNGVVQSAFADKPQGIVLALHSKDTAPSYAPFVQKAFLSIGFPVSVIRNDKYPEFSLTVIIGDLNY